jgi:O-antigen/teichoic acid export membrane protein
MRLRPIAARENVISLKKTLGYDARLMLLSVAIVIGIAFSLLVYSEKFLGQEFKNSGTILFFGVLTSIPMGIVLLTSSLLSSMGAEKLVAKVISSYSLLMLLGVAFGTFINGSLGAVLAALLIVSVYALIFSIGLRREFNSLK